MDYELVANKDSVRLWSDVRLPFEPKGEVRAMRDALRIGLAGLDGSKLAAAFGGLPGAAFDIENVLFYNVGCSAFRKCSGAELYFERRFAPSPAPSGRSWAWSHEYRTDALAKSWTSHGDTVAFVLNGEGPLPATAGQYWRATHLASVAREQTIAPDVPLFLSLRLVSPRSVNLTEAVKKSTDGIFSALHSYNGLGVEAVASRAAELLDLDLLSATAWMTRQGPLGPRRFVWPFGQGLQWSPADDRLVAALMTWEPSNASPWSLAVVLSEAVPARS